MTSPAVSVVIPTYNNPRLLAETLETVFAQAFTDYEVIVVNDGSTDDTLKKLGEYGNRIRVIDQPNGGIGVARNRGIDEARGKYVALLDHDDLWKPGKLGAQVAYMEANPKLSACSVRYSYTTFPDRPSYDFDGSMGPGGVIRRPMRHLSVGCTFLISSAIMFDREKARGLRYETRRQCIEDVPFQVGLFARGEFGIAGEGILMVYRWHESNSSKEAGFYYNGIALLRELDGRGELPVAAPAERKDLLMFLGYVGRVAAASQLIAGKRGNAMGVYRREFGHQFRLRRWRFLVMFMAALVMPNVMVRKYFGGR